MLIAHLSDLHVFSLKGATPFSFFGKRILGGANLLLRRGWATSADILEYVIEDVNQQPVEHVLISGDIGNLTLSGELKEALAIIGQLKLPSSEISVVPGNHDRYTQFSRFSDDFETTFAPYQTSDVSSATSTHFAYPFVRIRGDIAMIALSTAYPSLPLLATGSLGTAQLARLFELLQSTELSNKFRIVMLHHPPEQNPKTYHVHAHKRLTDAAEFQAILEKTGADLVVHGHLHKDCFGRLPGPLQQIPTIGVRDARQSYNLYEIEDKKIKKVRTRSYDFAQKAFLEVEVPLTNWV